MNTNPASLIFESALLGYSLARSAHFTAQYRMLNALSAILPGGKKGAIDLDERTIRWARGRLVDLLRRDAANIGSGVYPASVLAPESLIEHAKRLPQIIADGMSIYRRRGQGRTTDFDSKAREFLGDLPRYYRRNFHFQTGGYLSEKSASLYEHQVEMLFSGTADAMRRLIIPPLRGAFGKGNGHGLTFLEIGAGTGRATRFVHLAFPKARIVVVDLSDMYLKQAQKKLRRLPRIDFVQADGAKLPFQSEHFDAVYSVFLFHELPMEARKEVLAESHRVLKKGGVLGLVDSAQRRDMAELDPLLENFPKEFHEPFYRNYAENPMERLLEEQGFRGVDTDTGFFSKVCWAQRP